MNEALVLARVKTQLRIKRLTDDLRRSATKDVLTKLPNRLSFEEILAEEWPRAVSSGREIGLMMFELDHFEAYVERYGHAAADQTVRKVAQVLRRTTDHPAHYLARIYRSTFAILMPETSQEQAERMAWAAMNGIEKLGIEHATSTTSMHVTTSAGLSVYDRACSGWAEPDQAAEGRRENPIAMPPTCATARPKRWPRQNAMAAARHGGWTWGATWPS
ncbi:MAG: diguanylate cyclase [Burkholderiaceae bacterium]